MTRSTALLDELLRDQLASTNPTNWRRLLLGEPKRKAKTIPLRDTYAASQVPTVTRTKDEVAIAPEPASVHGSRNDYTIVREGTPGQWQPATCDAECAMRLLKSVPAPLTTERVARALSWSKPRARRWLARFAAKGVLIATKRGHEWRNQ